MDLRLVDAGVVSPLRSQALYHGIASAWDRSARDTVVVAVPAEPYVCVGFHQDLEREVDLGYCRDERIPVLRRETGGGTVCCDQDQCFVQWILHAESLPARIERRFELFARPIVETYRALGVAARFHPVNDVQVFGRKISGTGAARIGEAEVLIGNFIFDFDNERMARVLRAPSPAFRALVRRSLDRYMSSLRAELGHAPTLQRVVDLYRASCERTLGRELVEGELSAAELAAVDEAERRLASRSFVGQAGGLHRPGVKIHADVEVVERVHDARGAKVRATARLRQGRIEALVLDASSQKSELAALARALLGVEPRRAPVSATLAAHEESHGTLPVFGRGTWLEAIMRLAGEPEDREHDRRSRG